MGTYKGVEVGQINLGNLRRVKVVTEKRFLNYNGSFSYQGIKEFYDGFFENGYHLKPFPTHYIKIDKPANALYI